MKLQSNLNEFRQKLIDENIPKYHPGKMNVLCQYCNQKTSLQNNYLQNHLPIFAAKENCQMESI